MSFNDDEPIVTSGPRPKPIMEGRVTLKEPESKNVPVGESDQMVMLKLTANDSPGDRLGLDLVAVLDVSGSMQGEKINKMKTAMQFVIMKLGPIDRLSIVTFSGAATRLCPLRQITKASQAELLGFIAGLNANGNTNISDGLSTGLKVLADRKLSRGRVVGVILMSDGEQNQGDAAQVAIGNVPVYTFGFGADYDPKVLHAVAKNSMGGTFSVIYDTNDGLSKAFSQSLAILLTVVVMNLKLTVSRIEDESEIQKVNAGSYPQTPNAPDANTVSVTVTFGNLSSKEVRNVIVDLHLLGSDESEYDATILYYEYSYDVEGMPFTVGQTPVLVKRTDQVGPQGDQPAEMRREVTRLETVTMIKEARTLADGKNMEDARDKVVEAQNALLDVEDQNPLVDMLMTELAQLMKLMKSQDVYEKQGRPYALSSETSHDLQRFAARGDIESLRLFATPRMDKYLEQAKKFDEDPEAPLPSVDEDVKEERAANPLASISGPITFYIHNAIQALQAIERLITNGGKA